MLPVSVSLPLLLVSLLFSPSLPFPALAASSASLSVSPALLTRSFPTVSVRWSGVPSPSPLDWLGIYSPPSSPDDQFIGYLFLNSTSTWLSGAGDLSITLADLRAPYAFRLFRWTPDEVSDRHHDHDHNPLPGTGHRLAASPEVAFAAGDGPGQIHLAFTEREDEVRVMFVAGDGGERAVRYGRDEGALDRVERAAPARYERTDMCDFPANSSIGWRDPGFIYDAVMRDLEPGARYYYKVS